MAVRQRAAGAALLLVLAGAASACGGDDAGDRVAAGPTGSAAGPTGGPSGPAPAAPPTAPPTGSTTAPSSAAPSRPPAPPAAAADRRPTGEPVTLAFGGDVHFEGVSRSALSGGLAAITPALSAADLTMVNLETAVTERGSGAAKEFAFRAPPAALPALQAAGVDVVTLANNHGMDFGQVGLADTLAAARAAGLPLVGAGEDEAAAFAPHVVQVRGQRIAVIGATQVLDANLATAWTATADKPGLASAKDVDRLLAAVRDARSRADTVVVDLHWGTEQASCPNEAQRALAPQLVAAGADVVVGSHAHVLLGGGYLGGAYVDYGLGNFVFYARTPQTQATGVLTLTVQGRAVTAARWAPAQISGGVPRPLQGAAAGTALAAKERLRGCTGLAAAP